MPKLAPLILLVAAAAIAQAIACLGASTEVDRDDPCESPLDCALRQSCIDGACVDAAAAEGEGEGEGEGEVDERAAIEGICNRVAACQGGAPSDCTSQLQSQIDQMRRIGTPVCFEAISATIAFFACGSGLTCEQINNDFAAACPIVNDAQQLQSECTNGVQPGEGEGEGE